MYTSPSLVPPPRRYQKEFKNQPRALEMLCGLITDLFVDRQVLCHATVMLCYVLRAHWHKPFRHLLRQSHKHCCGHLTSCPLPRVQVGRDVFAHPHLPHLTVVCVLVWLVCGWCLAGLCLARGSRATTPSTTWARSWTF